MSKHTPGPWITEEAASNSIDIVRNFEIIADVINHNCDYLTYKDIANAKIIAAAPDLLEVAKRTAFIFDNESIYKKGTIGYDLAQSAKAAIQKATT